MKFHTWLACGATLLLLAQTALAAPIVSVDVDPDTAGIQDFSSLDIDLITSFDIDIVISGVEVGATLNAFEFDLDFDPSILLATSVIDGGFLLAPTFVVQNTVGGMTVEFAAVTLLPAGASGSGVLATISFDAIGFGISALDLNDVILSAPFGVEVNPAGIVDGSIRVTSTSLIPEPSAAALFLIGGILLSRGTRVRTD